MEMDTDSLFLVLADKNLMSCIREKKQQWELLPSEDCDQIFTTDSCRNFFCLA